PLVRGVPPRRRAARCTGDERDRRGAVEPRCGLPGTARLAGADAPALPRQGGGVGVPAQPAGNPLRRLRDLAAAAVPPARRPPLGPPRPPLPQAAPAALHDPPPRP